MQEMQKWQDSVTAVGTAVAAMKEAAAQLKAAVDAKVADIGKQVATDTSAV